MIRITLIRLSLGAVFALILGSDLAAQDMGFVEKFQEANRLDEENELTQSAVIWTQLASSDPDNANVNFKAGKAYLNSFNKKTAALPFLQRAIEGKINKNYDPYSPLEKGVPIEVYYYYAKALHLNYKLDKAQEYYEKFMGEARAKHFLYPVADIGRQQVDYAKLQMKKPVDFHIENLGPTVNSPYPDYSPVISVDENALFFTSSRLRPDTSNSGVIDRKSGMYYEDIYVSYRDLEGNWQEPELLNINIVEHTATVNVTVDGQTLFLYKNVDGDGNIFKSKLVGEIWSEPEPMGPTINSEHWETHLAITPDEQTIYLVSDRPGGEGGRDIYVVRKLPTGEWGEAENMGPVINTPYEEEAVFISPDNQTLYFSSQGHNSMGGFDIFYSALDREGNWSEPVNMGYPINTVDDDVFFVTSADGRRAYYSSQRPEGFGEKDLYVIELPDPRGANLAVLKGTIIPAEGESIPDDFVVYVYDRERGTNQTYTPRARDGVFLAILPPCSTYDIGYSIDGKVVARDTFSIACDIDYREIYKELLLSPVLVSSDGTVVVINSTSGDDVPATFNRNFGYNQNTVSLEEEMFAKFMTALKIKVMKNGEAEVSIVGSASKVPTKSYKSNDELAQIRAEKAAERIRSNFDKFNIDPDKVKFVSVKGKVQGPEYTGDFKEGSSKYEKYQYVDVTAR